MERPVWSIMRRIVDRLRGAARPERSPGEALTPEAQGAVPDRFFHDRSQFGEIPLLLRGIVNEANPTRTIVDCGARGVSLSNSYDLLRHFGWRGLLIEANPHLADEINAGFAGLDFELVNCAVSDFEGTAELFLGVNPDISSLARDHAAAWGPVHGSFHVPVRRLRDVLAEHGIPAEFDVLNLDIEGHDCRALTDLIDNSHYRPRWIIIEASFGFATKSLTDLPVSDAVARTYRIIAQTHANLILRRVEGDNAPSGRG
jgi:FkbM family methyltransferase